MPIALKYLHVLVALGYVSGLVGRHVALEMAARAGTMERVEALLSVSSPCEKYLVIPGSMAVLIFGIATAWAQGLPVLGFLQGGHINWVLAALILYLLQLPLIPLVFIPRGKQFETAMTDSTLSGKPLPALRAAFKDPLVQASRAYEIAVVFALVFLMVARPF